MSEVAFTVTENEEMVVAARGRGVGGCGSTSWILLPFETGKCPQPPTKSPTNLSSHTQHLNYGDGSGGVVMVMVMMVVVAVVGVLVDVAALLVPSESQRSV